MTLSEQIEHDLRINLLAGEDPPCPLTLSAIAAHFDVSLMPVRVAVDALVTEKLLARGPNGRLTATAPPPDRGDKSSPRARVPADSPEKRITDHVIALSLTGATSQLREEVTAEKFGIGRTVLRRILNRLAGEGLIEHLPRRGWQIRPYHEKDMLEFLEVREMHELLALTKSAHLLEPAVLREHLEANQPLPGGKPHLDNRLHRLWIERSENRYIRDFFDKHGVYFQALFDRAALDDATVERAAAEHRRILETLIKGDVPAACKALSEHIRGQRTKVAGLFKGLLTQHGD